MSKRNDVSERTNKPEFFDSHDMISFLNVKIYTKKISNIIHDQQSRKNSMFKC